MLHSLLQSLETGGINAIIIGEYDRHYWVTG
jgi:hypothetical protein